MTSGTGLPNSLTRMAQALRDTPAARRVALTALSLVRHIARAPAGVYTLCYHHVPASHRSNFARQLDYLARHGTFVRADEALELIRSGGARSGRFFLLSFDDGYADLVDVALPLLAKRAIPAIAFVVSSWLDSPPGPATARADGYLSRADLELWRRRGMDVGSHSHSHPLLINLSDDEVGDELRRSSAVLAEVLGQAPRHFACPWGVPERDFRPERAQRLAEAAGYVSFFTTTRGVATTPCDAWLMPRHVVEPDWRLRELDALIGGSRLQRKPFVDRQSWNEGQCRSSS